ncbi:MAG: helix-turn-helix transcriptional regulator [Paraglaciecola sp.]|uniref:helix-turn-helix transcriptional regulator n=1 Tax=Paraglaciecola sp. TaxID=1920173 RepID=UPI0032987D12
MKPTELIFPWHCLHPAIDQNLRPGLNFHFGDEVDTRTHRWCGDVDDRFRLIVVLEGKLDLRFSQQKVMLSNTSDDPLAPSVALVSMHSPVSFTRESYQGNYCRRISIGVSEQWLQYAFAGNSTGIKMMQEWQHLDVALWQADENILTLAENMLQKWQGQPALKNIYLESRAIELMLNAFTHKAKVRQSEKMAQPPTLIIPEQWLSFSQWLQKNAINPLNIETLAAQMSTTVSTLQRQFKHYFGQTVFEFIQTCRLELAMRKLLSNEDSITRVALDIGYGSSASFCTAFKRHFGMTPTQARINNNLPF